MTKIDLLSECNLSRLHGFEVSVDENDVTSLSTCFMIPVPGLVDLVTVSETFDLSKEKNLKLRRAVEGLASLIQESIATGTNVSGDPCGTCTSPCCSHFSESLKVTHEDVARIMGAGYLSDSFIKGPGSDPTWYGRMATSEVDGVETCDMFDAVHRRCGIHKIKPQVCRDYSPHSCDIYEEAEPELIQLRVSK